MLVPITQLGRTGCQWDKTSELIGLNPEGFIEVQPCPEQDLSGFDGDVVKLFIDDDPIFVAATVEQIIELSWGKPCQPQANSATE